MQRTNVQNEGIISLDKGKARSCNGQMYKTGSILFQLFKIKEEKKCTMESDEKKKKKKRRHEI